MSSSSVYGRRAHGSTVTSGSPRDANRMQGPRERDLPARAGDDFSPTSCATPRRSGLAQDALDLVVNDLAGHAWTERSSG